MRLKIFLLLFILLNCDIRYHGIKDGGREQENYITISAIQNVEHKDHPKVGEYVWLKNVVVTGVDQFDETSTNRIGSIWVQDINSEKPEYSGILIYKPDIFPSNIRLRPGDIVEIYGEYEEFCYNVEEERPDPYCPRSDLETLSEIGYAVVFKIGESLPPQPKLIEDLLEVTIPQNAEKWEGVLIKVAPPGGLTVVSDYNKYGEFEVEDSHGNRLNISNGLYQLPDLTVGMKFRSITGLFTWFFNYKLCPRDSSDIELME